MKNNILLLILFLVSSSSFSQAYEFETLIDLETTEVISQGKTGTCWSFSTTSFIESEVIRLTGKQIDISEMYNVRYTYSDKAWNFIMRQGNAQFSEGGLAHDVMNSIANNGLVPNYVFSGLDNGKDNHNHTMMVDSLQKVLQTFIKNPKDYSTDWSEDFEQILDKNLGEKVSTFNYEGVQYTPESFLKMTTINPADYVTITSFTHKPYYSSFILNIPDNFSNGNFYNVPLNKMINIMNTALKNGYTIELDCDVSEKTFSSKYGVAVIPEDDSKTKDALISIQKEKEISPEFRQQEFENYNTTDDHLMHIIGILEDQNGTTYYKVKNSWGKDSNRVKNGGFIYMSEAYTRLKTISIMIHKDALGTTLKSKLDLN